MSSLLLCATSEALVDLKQTLAADDLRVSSLTTCSSLLLCGCESRVWATGRARSWSLARVPLDSRDLLLEPRTASVEPPLNR
jgi:hypothetical protein